MQGDSAIKSANFIQLRLSILVVWQDISLKSFILQQNDKVFVVRIQ